jgi:hypothetical protein
MERSYFQRAQFNLAPASASGLFLVRGGSLPGAQPPLASMNKKRGR